MLRSALGATSAPPVFTITLAGVERSSAARNPETKMTFFEAAVAVLRDAGRPLHFKKIAAAATRDDLLSHTGREPEETMRARLSQEAKKPAGEAIIEEVRPGVFGVRAGADLDHAAETIALRAPVDVEEPEPVEDDADPEVNSLEPIGAPKVIRSEDDERRRRRRGRGRDRDRKDPARERNEPRRPRKEEPRAQEPLGDAPALTDNDLSDIARAVTDVLANTGRGKGVAASTIAKELGKRKVGRLGQLGTAALRDVLVETNTNRASDGRPPVFEETKPNFWTLATASGSSLAQSYAALERWQASHRNALASTIVGRLKTMDADALGTVVTLLLDRLGYQGLVRGEDGTTIGANGPRGLTRATVALRIFDAKTALDGEQVAALRGSLHQFSAAEGVVIAFGDVTDAAKAEVAVANVAPVTILDADDVARHMIAAGIGVARFSVDVSCLDEAVFREFRKA